MIPTHVPKPDARERCSSFQHLKWRGFVLAISDAIKPLT